MKLLRVIIISWALLITNTCNLSEEDKVVLSSDAKEAKATKSSTENEFDDLVNAFDAAIINSDPDKFYDELEKKAIN